jgi:hypothetical protein
VDPASWELISDCLSALTTSIASFLFHQAQGNFGQIFDDYIPKSWRNFKDRIINDLIASIYISRFIMRIRSMSPFYITSNMYCLSSLSLSLLATESAHVVPGHNTPHQ